MAHSSTDTQLLVEAYQLTLLKESFPMMTPSQALNNLELMSESEHEYVCQVSERIINEFFGGLKNIGKGISNAVKSGGQAINNAVSGQVQKAGNFAQNVGNGVKEVGKNFVDNTKDMYQTGKVDQETGKSIERARTATQQLIDLITKAQQDGLIKAQKPISDMTLSEIIDRLEIAKQSSSKFANLSTDRGFTGGSGKAFSKGFKS
jgi:predicted RNase H-like HicB family nuclease